MRPAKSISGSLGHHREWLRACTTGSSATFPFSYSGPLTKANHLGNVAYRAWKKIIWDAAKLKVAHALEAVRLIHRSYRRGWGF